MEPSLLVAALLLIVIMASLNMKPIKQDGEKLRTFLFTAGRIALAATLKIARYGILKFGSRASHKSAGKVMLEKIIVITNCFTTATALRTIVFFFSRVTRPHFIVSSFSKFKWKALFHEVCRSAICHKMQNLKSRFAIMLSRSMLAGLFETD